MLSTRKSLKVKKKNTKRLKGKGWKKAFHANSNQKRARVTTLFSNKIDIKFLKFMRFIEHYILIRGSIQKEDITIKI